ncbi:ABC transporter substrate-binding protein [Phycicoccus avicenniae]|uniref:ABC transporter substrate-binding protein n=1 Tax=Phycicoccus avicenniae TaxID=2828860 RepID=UPI003D2A7141
MTASRPTRRSALVLAVLTPLALAGCAGVDPEPTDSGPSSSATPLAAEDPNAKVELVWWTGQESDAQKILDAKVAAFTKQHPNVSIRSSSGAATTDDLLQKLSAGFAAGTYPDISYAFGSWASELGASGKTLDISADVADPAVKWDEISAAARETASPGGRTIGFPALVDNLALFYNKTLFDAAGVEYPTEQMTWDEFRATAKKLSDPSRNVFGTSFDVTGGEGTTWAMWPQLWQNGGQILSSDEKSATFNSDAGVRAVQFWRDMAVEDKSVYLDQTAEKAIGLFASNNIAMLITGPWALFDVGGAKTDYGVTLLPGTDGDHQTVSGPDLWVLFDHQDRNRAYWSYQFIRFLTDPAQDLTWNVVFGNLPLRSSEIQSPEFQAKAKVTPGYELLATNLENAKNKRPTVEGYVGLSAAYGKAVARLLQGEGEVKSALDEAAKAADRALADQ